MAVPNFGSGGGGFQVSPGINISEIDITSVVPAVSTTVGAFAGVFRWGPVGKIMLIDSETALAARYGKPTSLNAETWFTAASFLSYSNALYVSRAGNSALLSAVAGSATSSNATVTVNNQDDYDAKVGAFDNSVDWIARYPGALGNSLKISRCDAAVQYASTVELIVSNSTINSTATNTAFTIAVGSNTGQILIAPGAGYTPIQGDANTYANLVKNNFSVGDILEIGNTLIGTQLLKITALQNSAPANSTSYVNSASQTGYVAGQGIGFQISFDQVLKLSSNVNTYINSTSSPVSRKWEYYNQVDVAPGQSTFQAQYGNTIAQDELHLVVVDEDGLFTGNPGTVLETYKSLSRATDAKSPDGSSNYFKTVVNAESNYVWHATDRATGGANSTTAALMSNSTFTAPASLSFAYGADTADEGNTGISFGDLARAYDLFKSPEDVDISLIMQGKARGGTYGEQLANYIIDNITDNRKDCVAFVSPPKEFVVNNPTSAGANVSSWAISGLRRSSFGVADSGYKQMYDKYNDVYRYVPLNGDIAGLCVRTDNTRDPWYSPAGTARGQIKNIIKLAYNPNKADRDLLYKNGVNPVITQPGQGTVLFGDKTLLNRPSAFDRINVRRLFIVLEKAIGIAAKSSLFEFNDEFTRAQFRNLIDPYLRDVQGRRGIYDYKVVCDETNNTGEVIDSNRFVGDIYIKPAKSINYIQLNFVAVRSGIEFSEIVG
jgi:hypothetical protein